MARNRFIASALQFAQPSSPPIREFCQTVPVVTKLVTIGLTKKGDNFEAFQV